MDTSDHPSSKRKMNWNDSSFFLKKKSLDLVKWFLYDHHISNSILFRNLFWPIACEKKIALVIAKFLTSLEQWKVSFQKLLTFRRPYSYLHTTGAGTLYKAFVQPCCWWFAISSWKHHYKALQRYSLNCKYSATLCTNMLQSRRN